MDCNNTIILLTLILFIMVYNFSEIKITKEQLINNTINCPIYNNPVKFISIIHHPKLNKAFIILVSSKKATSIIQKSLKYADGYFTISKNNNLYYLNNKMKKLQEIQTFSINNLKNIKNITNLKLMGPT